MLNIDPEVLACTTSAMLIQIRADLWHYAWGKVFGYEWGQWVGVVVDGLYVCTCTMYVCM